MFWLWDRVGSVDNMMMQAVCTATVNNMCHGYNAEN